MQTKLGKYCEGIMEAAWLAAVVVVPVFFNVYSNRIFEPDKLALLRTLALVILAAWAVKIVEAGRPQFDRLRSDGSWLQSLVKIPLLAPVAALALVYILATVFSVTPATSLWGSYQRLQGTYTTFSYLVIFAALVANLRRRAQIERLVTAVILASLPVSLYGILQRYQIDPVPWGGNVAVRIAANLGNSIFVAAYLIMAFPLTAIRAVGSFVSILEDQEGLLANFSRATAYVFIAALQVIALIFSGSRGPLLGWLAGTFFLFLVLSLLWRKRWFTLGVVGATLLLGGFLVLLNIPNGPLEGLRSTPGIGRLGRLLDPESATGRVRVYIWKGAAELVLPHEPLEFPDGREDAFNFLRPLVGYGPESMYVAYNRFYPPELSLVEQRNASPDRSHNETWDSLVITGLAGLAVYLALFGAVFYYGLKWLGLVTHSRQRNLFWLLYIGGGLVSAAGFVLWQGLGFFGVGLPFGMILGVIVYLIWTSLSGQYQAPQTQADRLKLLPLVGLLAVMVAHFVEINFGIAIAVTRLYFWTFTGLLLLQGFILPRIDEAGREAGAEVSPVREASPKKKRRTGKAGSTASREASRGAWPGWLGEAVIGGSLLGLILATLGYDFIFAAQTGGSIGDILWNSFARLRESGTSYGILAMILTTWVAGGVVFASEGEKPGGNDLWARKLTAVLAVSIAVAWIFWLWHASGLAAVSASAPNNLDEVLDKVAQYESLLTRYYVFLGLLVFGLAFLLVRGSLSKLRSPSMGGLILAPLALVAVILLAALTNLRVIQADIAFKLADPFAQVNSWTVASAVYNRAINLAPSEDYYYLFLGRAYLETAKTLDDRAEQERLIQQAASDLKKAQLINPLNTDHTANLARLYSLWASFTEEEQLREQRAQVSAEYFEKAVTLSPNNSRLWNEWALLYMNVLQQPQEGQRLLSHSLEVDEYYDWTHALIAEYYRQIGQGQTSEEDRVEALEQALDHYQEAVRLARDPGTRLNYTMALGQLYVDQQQPERAIELVEEALQASPEGPESWRYEQALAQLYAQVGDKPRALAHANRALALAPAEQQQTVQSFITQLESQP